MHIDFPGRGSQCCWIVLKGREEEIESVFADEISNSNCNEDITRLVKRWKYENDVTDFVESKYYQICVLRKRDTVLVSIIIKYAHNIILPNLIISIPYRK